MKIEVYRKRYYPGGGYVIDDKPERVYSNVTACSIEHNCISGYIGLCEPINIVFDHINYNYIIS